MRIIIAYSEQAIESDENTRPLNAGPQTTFHYTRCRLDLALSETYHNKHNLLKPKADYP